MAARAALMVTGAIGVVIAVYLVIWTILGLLGRVAILSAFAIAALIRFNRRSADAVREKRKPAKGIVDRVEKASGSGTPYEPASASTGRWNRGSAGAWP